MFKKALFLGICSGILAAVAAIIYSTIYKNSLGADFSKIINPGSIIGSCLFGGILASVGYALLSRWVKGDLLEKFFPLLFATLSFASIVGSFSIALPLDISQPELFPGLSVPMHFFPVLAWLVLKPFFRFDEV